MTRPAWSACWIDSSESGGAYGLSEGHVDRCTRQWCGHFPPLAVASLTQTRWSPTANRQSVCLHQKSAFSENVVSDLDFRAHDLENVISEMHRSRIRHLSKKIANFNEFSEINYTRWAAVVFVRCCLLNDDVAEHCIISISITTTIRTWTRPRRVQYMSYSQIRR